jgi:hypothetical protein
MQIPIVQSIYDKTKPVNFSNSTIKIEQKFVENIRTGRANYNYLDMAQKDRKEFETNYLRDELGQIKYKLITGQLLDYRA